MSSSSGASIGAQPPPPPPAAPPEEEKKNLNSELWHACAGPLVCLPTLGTRVVYFPQGHSEQVAASTNKEVEGHIPNYPNLPPQLICQLHDVTMHADVETDEVYAQMTLQPLNPQEQNDAYLPAEMGIMSKQPTNYFCKTLTASDTSTHGGFSVPRRAAERVFPPLDFTQQPPAQELIARDIHDNEWKFRHIFRGQPKRHLLTTGWSVFVSAKRLVAGDSVLFIWNEKNQLWLGIRRASRTQTVMPSSVLSSDSMHIGLLAAAAHAASTNSRFTIFYNPRACPSEFVIPLSKYIKAVFHTRISVGMRFRMLFETEPKSANLRLRRQRFRTLAAAMQSMALTFAFLPAATPTPASGRRLATRARLRRSRRRAQAQQVHRAHHGAQVTRGIVCCALRHQPQRRRPPHPQAAGGISSVWYELNTCSTSPMPSMKESATPAWLPSGSTAGYIHATTLTSSRCRSHPRRSDATSLL